MKGHQKAPSMFLEYTQHDTALGEEIQENVWLNLAEDRESNKKYHPEAEETGMIYKRIGYDVPESLPWQARPTATLLPMHVITSWSSWRCTPASERLPAMCLSLSMEQKIKD